VISRISGEIEIISDDARMIRSRNVLGLTDVTGFSQKNRATHSGCKFRSWLIPRIVGNRETDTCVFEDFWFARLSFLIFQKPTYGRNIVDCHHSGGGKCSSIGNEF